jgi:hypothetical protein
MESLDFFAAERQDDAYEPTPIDTKNACFVNEVPLTRANWHHGGEEDSDVFIENLKRMLVQEPSSTSRNSSPPNATLNTVSVNRIIKRQRATPLAEEARRSSQTSTTMPNKRRLVVVSSAQSTVSTSSTTSEGGDSGLRNGHIEQWNQRYNELTAFHRELNHCLVPLNWEQNPSLAHWVKRQRYQYRVKNEGGHSTMTAERETALDDLGFVWDSHAVAWEERWGQLADFKQRFGHTNVPKKYPENPQLAVWVKCQRRQFKLYSEGKRSNTTPDRIRRLSSLGFVFYPRMQPNLKV